MGDPHSPVRVLPSALLVRSGRPLVEESLPPLMPCTEADAEFGFRRVLEGERKRSQFSPRIRLWLSRQILRHGLHLVELAVLNGNTFPLKYLRHASLSVYHGPGHSPPFLLERTQSVAIDEGSFKQRLRPPEVLLQGWRAEHEDTVSSAPERHVGGNHGRLRDTRGCRKRCLVKRGLYGADASAAFFCKLRERLPSPDVRGAKRRLSTRRLPLLLKDTSAGSAAVPLPA